MPIVYVYAKPNLIYIYILGLAHHGTSICTTLRAAGHLQSERGSASAATMSAFSTAVSRLETVLESSKSAGAPDSQAGQLEVLHEIQMQLRLAPPDDIKAAQTKLESNLTTALLQVRA